MTADVKSKGKRKREAPGATGADAVGERGELYLEAYVRPGYRAEGLGLSWSGRERDWFTPGFYHCLPLQIANQVGWLVRSPCDFSVTWDGGEDRSALKVEGDGSIVSYFGHGIFTYPPPMIFRTPPGVGLLVKAVPNLVKDGVWPLEAFVETDNLRGTFTFNVAVTRPNFTVRYAKGEPLAQVVPYPRNWIERFEPRVLGAGPRYDEMMREVIRFEGLRRANLERDSGLKARDWKYFRGEHMDGTRFPDHQKKLPLREFAGFEGVAGEHLVEALRGAVAETKDATRLGHRAPAEPAPAGRIAKPRGADEAAPRIPPIVPRTERGKPKGRAKR